MKDILKQERGVSLISLAAAIIIIGIITTMLLYSVGDTKDVTNLTNLYSDIDNLSDKVGNYYATYGKIPAFEKAGLDAIIQEKWGTKEEPQQDSPVGENDTGKFLVIDLNAIENLTLNYGRAFNTIEGKSQVTSEDTDLYIINENSHNVFYLQGIKVDEHTYYTNRDKDSQKVDLRYVDGIKIYDGYTYKSGDKKSGIIISNNTDEYIWANVEDGIYKISKKDTTIQYTDDKDNTETINISSEKNDEFLNSVEEFGGFYLSTNGDNTVLYFPVTDKWSMTYDSESMYKDKNGNTAYIPKGFQVSKLSTMNTIENGLVIRDATTLDEYVWVDIPDDVLKEAHSLDEIENTLKKYVGVYSNENYNDSWYDGCGIDNQTKYNELKNKMYQSIKKNGGFYIGRYEAGKGDNKAVSQKDKEPYNNITVSQAQKLVYSTNDNKYTTSLMFGIQWDIVCKFIEVAGINNKNSNLNIYDFETNNWEWTLEQTLNKNTLPCTARGGDDSSVSKDNIFASHRYSNATNYTNSAIAFRIALFK